MIESKNKLVTNLIGVICGCLILIGVISNLYTNHIRNETYKRLMESYELINEVNIQQKRHIDELHELFINISTAFKHYNDQLEIDEDK